MSYVNMFLNIYYVHETKNTWEVIVYTFYGIGLHSGLGFKFKFLTDCERTPGDCIFEILY